MKHFIRCLVLLFLTQVFIDAAETPPDIADMKVEDLRAGGDEKKRYFVIHQPGDTPKEGWRTLFVLPGGPGNAEFQPFVTRIAKNALSKDYLVVQLVAPVWSEPQAQNLVWPTSKLRMPEVKFTTEDFYLAVRAEVAKKHKLDARYSFVFTWSSSGLPGYVLPLLPDSGLKGSFVAMSAFNFMAMPPLGQTKGHPYYILHSPQDFIPIAQVETGRTALEKAGAIVELQKYEGGHGWRGDVFGNIRRGIEWLEGKALVK
ncbi:hypothetical protein AYO49_05080 [Verrucomicrobiaceae bacterium SCGC AG-212-N21]|nr:hypothetical protein AYO49_05080 [Verrucomicrobiaceae bacterium SCGC AG-212-N21]